MGFFYHETSIDCLKGWQKIGDFVSKGCNAFGCSCDFADITFLKSMGLLDGFRKAGWDREIFGTDVYVSGLPEKNGASVLMYAIRQSNNRLTFIASPYRLPWLDENE